MRNPAFYLATGLPRREEAQWLASELRARGWQHTYDWAAHGSMQAHPDQWSRVASAEMVGVRTCKVLLALLPGGFGTHAEIGAAIALGKQVVLVYPGELEELRGAAGHTCIFYFHPAVHHARTIDEAIALVEAW